MWKDTWLITTPSRKRTVNLWMRRTRWRKRNTAGMMLTFIQKLEAKADKRVEALDRWLQGGE